MATNKNITMKQFNGVDYDILYPKTIASQIDDVYSKSETSNLFLPKAGGSMGGILDMNGNRITNLPSPTSNSEPATKEYVDGNKVQKTFTFLTNYATTESYYCVLRELNDFSYIRISTSNKNGQRYNAGMTIKAGNVSLYSYYSYYSTGVIASLVKGDDGNFVVSGSVVVKEGENGIVSGNNKISLSDLKTHGIAITINMETIDTGDYSCGSIIVI